MARLAHNPDGWVTLTPGPHGLEGLHVRVRNRDGRLVITDIYIHAPEITSEILRGVSVSRLEATLNARVQRSPSAAAAVFSAVLAANVDDDEPEPSLTELRRRVPGATTTAGPERLRLTRPGSDPPEVFYPRVAAAYVEYAPQTRAPAKQIAAEAGVPVTTAHRWIREARRRGLLPPARKGKAG